MGGDSITITGTGFGIDSSVATVVIDGIDCPINSITETTIVCTTGDKGADNHAAASIAVTIDGNLALMED